MLSINLLPPEERKNIKIERWRRAVIFLAAAFSLILILGGVLLLPSFLPMFFEKKELNGFISAEKENETRRRLNVSEDLENTSSLREKVNLLEKMVSPQTTASGLLEDILSRNGVVLIRISADKDGLVAISGTVKNRRDLLGFEEALRSLDRFSDVHSPLSSLVRGATNFSIQARLKPEQKL